MTRGFVVAEGESAGFQVDTPVLQLWWGPHEGAMLGLLTDHMVASHERLPRPDELERLALLCHPLTMTGFLADDRLAAFIGMDPRDCAVAADEVDVDDFIPTVVVVDGQPSRASFITYRGLDFVLGDDVEHQPYAMARPTGLDMPWPSLRLVDLTEKAWT